MGHHHADGRDLHLLLEAPPPGKLLKAVRESGTYIRANAGRIPDYGERYRCGEIISTALTESAVNQVISKRMVKKQQMRWSPRGAHLFLQVRTQVLNDDLAADFTRWYPGFSHPGEPAGLAAQGSTAEPSGTRTVDLPRFWAVSQLHGS